jgi:hypothetical protein
MTWRGRETALECKSVQEFAEYLQDLDFNSWRPSGMVLHNTASPTLAQWWGGGTPPEQRMVNLRNYYENEMGWSAGPHAFIDGKSIWVFTDFDVPGVHSPSWNGTRLGIEMVGDYDTESDESGMGAKVMQLTVGLFAECHAFFGWEPSNNSIKLHKEDPATDHDCPGANIVKSEFVADVTQCMGEGGDHNPGEPEPPAPPQIGTVFGLAAGDRLNIRASASSNSPVIGTAENDDVVNVVGEAYNGSTRWLRLSFGTSAGTAVEINGWASAAYITIDGETEPGTGWHEDITATVFGGSGDEQESAYGGMVDPDDSGCAVPYKWRDGPRPTLRIRGPRGEDVCAPVDVGPWNIDNPEYVLGDRRPAAEAQHRAQVPAQNGQVPTNDAGIDLTPYTAEKIGVDGKGKVSWKIEA